MTSALIADDEPLLRETLERLLATAWPELQIVARGRNGREAVDLYELFEPDVCFLDIKMPGLSGIEAARAIGRRSHIVFVTAFEHYAVQAFETGVLDYIVKPVALPRLVETIDRVKERLSGAAPRAHNDSLLDDLLAKLTGTAPPRHLRWLQVQVGPRLRMISVEQIDYLRSDAKYTAIAWRNDAGQAAEALVRTSVKELAASLDPDMFLQIHRSVVVNIASIDHVMRGDTDTGTLYLKGRAETLPVSRNNLPRFRGL